VSLLKEKLPLPTRRTANIELDLAQPFVIISENDNDLVKVIKKFLVEFFFSGLK
jgi:hypothetical protein